MYQAKGIRASIATDAECRPADDEPQSSRGADRSPAGRNSVFKTDDVSDPCPCLRMQQDRPIDRRRTKPARAKGPGLAFVLPGTLFLCRLNTTSNKNTSPSDGRRAMDQQGYIWPAPASGAPVSPHPSRPRPLLHAACLPRTIYTKPSGCAALLTTNPAIRHPVDAARASPCVSCACASHPLTPPSRRPLPPGRLLLPALSPGPLASRKRHTPMLERATHEQPRAHRAAAKRGGAAERRLDGAGQPDEMHAARLQQGSARRRRAIL